MQDRSQVKDLEANQILLIQDGNHGEYRPRANEFTDSGVSFIRAADVVNGRVNFEKAQAINEVAMSRIRKGIGKPFDVLLTHKGTVGRVAFVDIESPAYVCSPQTTFWRSLRHDILDPRFLFSFLQSHDMQSQLRSRQNESDMAAYVSLTEQRNLWISIPSIATQRAIVEVVGALDDKIAVNDRIESTINALMVAYLEASLSAGSDKLKLGEVAEFHNRKRVPLSSKQRSARSGHVPYYGAAGVVGYVDEPIFSGAHVLVGEDGTVKTADGNAVVQYVWGEFWVNNHAHVLTSKTLSTEALAVILRVSNVSHLVSGAVQPKLSMRNLSQLELMIPSEGVLLQFEKRIAPLMAMIRRKRSENDSLARLRDTLLPRLMSGEIRVKDAEKAMEEAT